MGKNPDIWLISIDLGFNLFNDIRRDFPERFINTGASEMGAMGLAVGLALEGKIPFIYSITNFLLYRPFETIRNYVAKENIKVILCGSGRDFDYHTEGWSHHSPDAKAVLDLFPTIHQYWPEPHEDIAEYVEHAIQADYPLFLSLKK